MTTIPQEDLVGYGILGFYECIDRWVEGGATVDTFTFLSVRGRMIDAIRREQGRYIRPVLESLEGMDEGMREKIGDLSCETDLRLDADIIQDVIRLLPFGDVVVLIAYYWLGMTVMEIGDAFGVSDTAVSIRKGNAEKAIRFYLEHGRFHRDMHADAYRQHPNSFVKKPKRIKLEDV